MRTNVMRFATATIALVVAAITSEAAATDLLLTHRSAGRIRLGDPADKVERVYQVDHSVRRGFYSEDGPPGVPSVEVYSRPSDPRDAEHLLVAILDDAGKDVVQILVYGQRFKTSRGIGIGASFRTVTAAYGRPVMEPGEGVHYAIYRRPAGVIAFGFISDSGGTPPPTATVLHIFISRR